MTTPLQLGTIWGPERWELEGTYLAMLDSSTHLVRQGFDTFESDVKFTAPHCIASSPMHHQHHHLWPHLWRFTETNTNTKTKHMFDLILAGMTRTKTKTKTKAKTNTNKNTNTKTIHRPDIGRVDSASLSWGCFLHVGQDRLLLLWVPVTLPAWGWIISA